MAGQGDVRMEEIIRKAFGKVNLALDITGVRADGYHEVRMILENVGLYDTVRLRRLPAESPEAQTGPVRLQMDPAGVTAGVPTDARNIAFRAAQLMQETYAIRDGVEITITKRIPVAAGMAGGSTDAAAVLRGMNRLFDLGIPEEELMKTGLALGADVPFCVHGGTMLAEGIGEKLTAVPGIREMAPESALVLVKPSEGASTGAIYRGYDGMPEEAVDHPNLDRVTELLRTGAEEKLLDLFPEMKNVLEPVTRELVPVIPAIEEQLLAAGAEKAMMTGSGPTVFGIFRNRAAAERAAGILRAWDEERIGLAGTGKEAADQPLQILVTGWEDLEGDDE